jgi:transcriptional regulator with XRE-family HTH domain
MTDTIGARIKMARAHAGLTQKRLAEKIGMSTGSIGAWEVGRLIPEDKFLHDIAAASGLTEDQMLNEFLPALPKAVPEKDQGDRMLVFIEAFIHEHGYSPTVREIVAGGCTNSTSHASIVLTRLRERGEIVGDVRKARAYTTARVMDAIKQL